MALVNPVFGLMERIDIRRIHPSQCPLRDSLGNIHELARSIEEKGLLQPIIVRPYNSSLFEVVAGNRRLAACKLIKWKKIPCYIVDFDDKQALEVSIIENIHHESLDYIEEAKAFNRYVEERSYGAASELARRIGKSPSYVSRRMALLELPKPLQEELLRHRKSSSIAQELVSLDEEQKNEIGKLILDSNLTTREVRKVIRSMKKEEDEGLCPSYYSLNDKRQHMMERTLTKYTSSLKVCLMRLDEALDYLDRDEWILWNTLMEYRSFMHGQIDSLVKLEMKVRKLHRLN